MMALGLAYLNLSESLPARGRLLQRILDASEGGAEQSTDCRSYSNIAWALAITRFLTPSLLTKVERMLLEGRQVGEVPRGEVPRRELAQLWQARMAMRADGLVPQGPGPLGGSPSAQAIFQELLDACRISHSISQSWSFQTVYQPKKVTRIHMDVYETLVSLGGVCELETMCDGLPVDIAFPLARLALEVDGPSHFTMSGHVTGETALKRRLLTAAGWRVISVPYHHINKLRTVPQGLQLYLHSLVNGLATPLRQPLLPSTLSQEERKRVFHMVWNLAGWASRDGVPRAVPRTGLLVGTGSGRAMSLSWAWSMQDQAPWRTAVRGNTAVQLGGSRSGPMGSPGVAPSVPPDTPGGAGGTISHFPASPAARQAVRDFQKGKLTRTGLILRVAPGVAKSGNAPPREDSP
eukprot:jgi/Botrbrau1/21066/Bobra.0144s0065.1